MDFLPVVCDGLRTAANEFRKGGVMLGVLVFLHVFPGFLLCSGFAQEESSSPLPVAILEGTDFRGGANLRFGTSFLGKTNVNYVYASTTGELSCMQAAWKLEALPASPLYLHLTAADDDAAAPCSIRISLNGQTLFEGKSPFPNGIWETVEFVLPAEVLRVGENLMEIQNLEKAGRAGSPPWFMVTEAVIAEKNFTRPLPPIRLERSPDVRSYQVGLAKIKVTPKHPVLLSGYAGRAHQLTLNVQQDLWARAIAVGSDSVSSGGAGSEAESPALLIVVDNVGVPASVRQAVLEKLAAEEKISSDRLTICSTHTHSSPMLTGVLENLTLRELTSSEREAVDKYTDQLTAQLVQVARKALRDRQPAYLYRGLGETHFAINRRQGPGTDPSVPVLVVADEAGTPRGVIANYACHCVSGGMGPEIHGDWATCAAEEMERLVPGTTALVLIGCGGDQNPRDRDGFAASRRQGKMLAEEVRRVLGKEMQAIDGKLVTTFSEIELPLARIPTAEQLRQKTQEPGITGYLAKRNLARLESGEKLAEALTYPVQTWQFGNSLALVFLGGEVVVDYGLALKQIVDPARVWITAYANDVPCYFPTDVLLKAGAYEALASMEWYDKPGLMASGTQDRILNEAKRQLAEQVGDLTAWEHLSAGTGGTVPLSPEESIARMRLPEGFRVEVVAAEPLVVDPVAIDFGPDGKLWVAEMRDYPEGVPGMNSPGGVIKFLEDLDGDGKYDRATTFLEGVAFPTGVTAWKNGVLICSAPDVLYAEDTDGDGRADLQKVVLNGFATHNYQARVNSLSWGLDNWMYGAAGIFGGEIRVPGTAVVDTRNRDFRFLPDGNRVQGVSGRTQQGRVRDDWGNWFGCSNSVLLQNYPLTEHYYTRNPRVRMPAPDVGMVRDPQLFPAGQIVGFALSGPPGRPTSVCGLGIYRDAWLGEEFQNNAFSCEPVNQVVHRRMLKPQGSSWLGVRPESERDREFLSSSDNWFRPVQVRTGPEGALWVVDMYRYVIEHPKFISDDVKAGLQIRAGADRGRIYRVVREERTPRSLPNLRELTAEEIVPFLESDNGTVRDLAHQELLWRNASSVSDVLKRLACEGNLPQGRLQALSVLDGLELLEADLLLERISQEEHPGVQRHLIRLSEKHLAAHPELAQALGRYLESRDAQVRLQLAYSLGEASSPVVSRFLATLLQNSGQDVYLQSAVFSSLNPTNIGEVLGELRSLKANRQILEPALLMAAEMASPETLSEILGPELTIETEAELLQRLPLLNALRGILVRRQRDLEASQKTQWQAVAERARTVLRDETQTAKLRAEAVPLVVSGECSDQVLEELAELLLPHQPSVLQQAVINALPFVPEERGTALLLDSLRRLPPVLQNVAINRILSDPQLTKRLLDQIESQTLSRTMLDLTRQQELTSSPYPEIQERARNLFSETTNAEISRQLTVLRGANMEGGDRGKGREVFVTHCAACHLFDGQGHAVGPDLAALTDKSKDYLVTAIVDPNAVVDRRYANYLAHLQDGRVFNGILASERETSIFLKEKAGVERELFRADLEELIDSGKSMMPEGFGKEIPQTAMKDLLAFLQATHLGTETLSLRKPVNSRFPAVTEMAAQLRKVAIGTPQEYEVIPEVFRLSLAAGRRNNAEEIRAVLDFALPLREDPLRDWEAVVIGGGIINGISQEKIWPAARLQQILAEDSGLQQRWQRALSLSMEMADNEQVKPGTRYDALRMVAMLPFAESGKTLEHFLKAGEKMDLIQGAVSGLVDVPHPAAAVLLAMELPKLPERLRPFAVEGLVRGDQDRCYILEAMASEKISAQDIPAHITELLRQHDNIVIRQQAQRLFGN